MVCYTATTNQKLEEIKSETQPRSQGFLPFWSRLPEIKKATSPVNEVGVKRGFLAYLYYGEEENKKIQVDYDL